MRNRLPFVWDYDIDEDRFKDLLTGKIHMGLLNQDWAILRLLEYASYSEIVNWLGFRGILEHWPKMRNRIRSPGRKRGFDFLIQWLPEKHPEKL